MKFKLSALICIILTICIAPSLVAQNPLLQVDMTTLGGTNIPFQAPVTGTPRDFGNVAVATSSSPITIVLSNQGAGTLTVSSIDMGGTWWNQYLVVPPATMPIALTNGQSASFTVAFQPTSTGIKNAYVRIVHNGWVSQSPYEVPVLGSGGAAAYPLIGVSDSYSAIVHNATVSGPRDFGAVAAGNASSPVTITVDNSGGVALNVGLPTLAGTSAGQFILTSTGFGPSIAGSANSTFTITFSPTSIGHKTAVVYFAHDDTSVTSPFIVNISGSAYSSGPAAINVSDSAGAIAHDAAAAGPRDFGTVLAGNMSTPITIIVTNNGGTNLNVGVPTLIGVDSGEFTIDTTGFGSSIAIGASDSFTVSFSPTVATGAKTAKITLVHDDTAEVNPFVINLSGNTSTSGGGGGSGGDDDEGCAINTSSDTSWLVVGLLAILAVVRRRRYAA